MTREELKRQVSDAGKYFIDEVTSGRYLSKWFDIQTLVGDFNTDRVLRTIDFYNRELDRWLKSGLTNDGYRELCYGYYCALEGMLNILRDIAYYDVSKYGDFDPFRDYCWSCWYNRQQILFSEYVILKNFFED